MTTIRRFGFLFIGCGNPGLVAALIRFQCLTRELEGTEIFIIEALPEPPELSQEQIMAFKEFKFDAPKFYRPPILEILPETKPFAPRRIIPTRARPLYIRHGHF